ncbi:Superfamily II DNA or RNA helicase, SNF2 family [Alteribacillus iranensis]|uniref:Superfamily II DNA or RNA helicase, SNF2 family n=1 Tax=Alteribacillus iranensis TaxID=930128 RepID=A0A1I2DFP4_9BACI|nr:Superfamily II DNA or RNA helicase, SNF2 family [Alteribacillus iranensis]
MRFPTKDKIRKLAGKTIYSRALSYWSEGRVKNINKNVAGSHTKITAMVSGTSLYEVDLLFHEDGDMQKYTCSCPAHQDIMDICKHIAAVLLTLSPVDTPPSHENRTTSRKKRRRLDNVQAEKMKQLFMDHFTGRMHDSNDMDGEALQAEYHITFHKDYDNLQELFLSVQLRIGTGKRYIVKDAGALFQSLRERSMLPITKTFTFDPTYHYFTPSDEEALRLLEQAFINEQWAGKQTNLLLRGDSMPSSDITIPPIAAEPLIRALTHCANVYITQTIGNQPVPLMIKSQWPGTFHLAKERENYYLSYSSYDYPPRPISLTPFYVWNDRLFEMPEDENDSTKLLYQMLMDTPKGRIQLDKGEIEQVYSKLSLLKTKGRITVEEQVDRLIAEYPVEAKVYLDKRDNVLYADPIFVYGPHSFHAITEDRHYSDDTTIIARDTKKEEKLLHLIETAGFHWNGDSLTLADSDTAFYFLTEVLPLMHEEADVFMSNEVEKMLIQPEAYAIESTLDETQGWLDISFRTDDIKEEELQALMASLKEKKTYFKTQEGNYVALNDEMLSGLRQLMEESGADASDWQDGSLRLPSYKTFQADHYLNQGRQWNKAESVNKLLQAVNSPEMLKANVPAHLDGILRDYQERGFKWMKALSLYGFGGILADDMGLGKTIQTLSYICSEREEHPTWSPFLVVAPSSLTFNWKKEVEMFAPSLNIRLVYGPKAERRKQLENLEEVDIIITSYPLLRRDTDLYEDLTFHGLILDEAQALKNFTSKTFRAVKMIQARRVFAISGTPIENKIDELWSLFAIIMPGLFPDVKTFKDISPHQVRNRVSPFILRRTKKEVLKELPDKIETNRHCELSKEQRETYVAYLNRIKQETKAQLNSGSFQENRMNILANLTRLRQLCCHPGMFLENYEGGSGKLDELLHFMKEAKANGQRVLIFSQFTTMLSMIAQAFDREGWSYYYLDGRTPSEERVKMADQFNNGDKDAFLISLKAGGTGLNLTGADTVVLFDLWWNPAVEHQAADRAHRIGQKRVVQVIKLISQGTIEEKIQALQNKKKALFDQVIQSGETNLTSLSEEDIRELLDI